MRRLIVTADDFGMSTEINEAVEEAHRRGILTCASLVVTGAAAGDAVARARRMPHLGVGLHLALVAAAPVLDPMHIPALVDRDTRELTHRPAFVGLRMALSHSVRVQARAEITAQLEAWRRTGLQLDHVDGHWHFHQHPSIVEALLDLASAHRIRAVRVPYEPALASWRAAGRRRLFRRVAGAASHRWLTSHMRQALRRKGIVSNDWFFGKADGGHMTRERLLGVIANLSTGVSEVGLHPATRSWTGRHAPPAHWRAAEELSGLTNPDVAEAIRSGNIELVRFGDLPAQPQRA